MSLRRCIPEMLNDGRIDEQQAERMRRLFDEYHDDYRNLFGESVADHMASQKAIDVFAGEALQAKRQALLQVTAQARIGRDVGRYTGKDKGAAVVALFDHDGRAPYSNVDARRRAIEGQAHSMMEGVLMKHSRNMAGQVRGRASLLNLVREAFGENTGDLSAKELAQSWSDTAEMLRMRFNAAGGGIGKLERWGLPQTHDTRAVRAAGFDEWRAFIAPRLDRQRMRNAASGGELSSAGFEASLKQVFTTIRSEGWANREPGGASNGKKLANRHADSRFLVFKDADSWLEYSRKFGRPLTRVGEKIDPDGPIFDAMMGHISGMSRDIALAEILGPNPAATVRWIKDSLVQAEAVGTSPDMRGADRAYRATRQVQRMYDEISGSNSRPENQAIALGFSAFRSWQTAAKLGSATLSAVTDVAFQQLTRRFNHIPAAKVMNGYVRLLRPGSVSDRALAIRLGLIAEEASKHAAAQSRYIGEVLTGEVSARLAEGVLRASGLSAWTQAGRWAFGMEFLSHVTHVRGAAWDKLDPGFQRTLARYGFGSSDWDAIRLSPVEEHRGSVWLMPSSIARTDLRDRLMEMILTETDFAVPVASLRTRAMMNSLAPKGTLGGEILRSALLFKSFGISMMLTHGRRMIEQDSYNKLRYAAALTISTTLLGALAMQLKGVARGQDPQPMDSVDFWAKAGAQGGGWGIYGDFVNSATSRFGDDIYSTAAGPLLSEMVGVAQMAKAKNKVPGLRRLIQSNTPGSSIWYVKLAFQREMLDQMQSHADPYYYESFSRMEKRSQDDHNPYWWHPGQTAPTRAPDVANATGG
jgi:hypothetical protein